MKRTYCTFALVMTLLVACVAVSLVTAYAKVAAQREAIAGLLQRQTGLAVSFSRLQFRLGVYGPEAVFRDVQLRRPGEREPVLRAPELAARFELWRILREGRLQPGRVVVRGAAIRFERLEARSAVAPAPSPLPDQAWIAHAAALAARLPVARLEFESLAASDGSWRAPTLSFRRWRSELRASGTVLLPQEAGRSVSFDAIVHGDLTKPQQLHGTLRLRARALQLPHPRERSAVDFELDASMARGELAEARVLALRLRAPAVQPLELPAVALRLDRDARQVILHVDEIAVVTLRQLLATQLPRVAAALDIEFIGGQLKDVDLRFSLAAPRELRLAARLADVELASEASRLPIAIDSGRFDLADAHWRLGVESGRVGPLALSSAHGDLERQLALQLYGDAASARAISSSMQLGPIEATALAGLEGQVLIDAVRDAAGRWQLRAYLNDANWRPDPAWPAARGVRGVLTVGAGQAADGRLQGEWLGGPVSLELGRGLDLRGELRTEQAREWFGLHALPPSDERLSWRLRLPSLDPGRNGQWQLRAEAGGKLMRAELALDAGARNSLSVSSGAVRIGPGRIRRPQGRWVEITGGVAGVELTDLAALAQQVDAGARGLELALPVRVQLDVAALSLAGHELGPAKLAARLGNARRVVAVEGRNVHGRLLQVPGAPELQWSLERLWLPESTARGRLAAALADLQGLHQVTIADLRWGAREFGRLRATLSPDARSNLRRIELTHAAAQIRAQGYCSVTEGACRVHVLGQAAELGDMLAPWLGPGVARGRDARMHGDLSWPIFPGREWLRSLQGRISVAAQLGSLATGDGARWPGLAVLAAFDSSEQIEFDTLSGELHAESGRLRWDRLRIGAGGGYWEIDGAVDLVGHEVAQRMVWRDASSLVAHLDEALGSTTQISAAVGLLESALDEHATGWLASGSPDAPQIAPLGLPATLAPATFDR